MHEPVYHKVLWDGAVEVVVYGASRDWNYRGANREEMEYYNPGIVDDLLQIMGKHEFHRVYAPMPIFNATVMDTAYLTNEMLQGFYRGKAADGVRLSVPGDAYALASADCAMTVVYDPQNHQLVAMHCGRDALIDRGRLLETPLPRSYESVIYYGIERLRETGQAVFGPSLKAFIGAAIGPDSFMHPTDETILKDGQPFPNPWARVNQKLLIYLKTRYYDRALPNMQSFVRDIYTGKIDLVKLIQTQLVESGVQLKNVQWDGHDTAIDVDQDGNFLFHSNRRDKNKRNLVLVRLISRR